ncbi:MAG TPA: selenocysteine-specific translation elongation factor [Castellaniella sp.]|uniref:selenocysteine-specific translation elongation factor n=1 Tax=Castellaniella sp. TaxID=1955812 RepID=UPI002EDC9C75
MIVALAGHVDHGKTQLIGALTGIDTDRLPEEKQRGMTLDLGFAHLDFDDCEPVSFIDVPGHERFIRNMLAGMSGIDAALLVVAADDGIMPQTTEHLRILDLLHVGVGAVVVSKTDLVPAARVQQVTESLQAALHATTLREATMFAVSSRTSEGMADLSAWLHDAARRSAPRQDPTHGFRMPVDRAFTLPGIGTVVTGTAHSGQVCAGDVLILSPAGRRVRVRSLQIHGRSADHATRGQRCALNLADIGVQEIARGQWIVSTATHCITGCFDARIQVLGTEAHALRHWTPVHLHHGTGDVPARIAVTGEGEIPAGTSGLVQIIPQEPMHALWGDRFILRDQSARRTLAGGTVLNPFAPRRGRRRDRPLALRQIYERASESGILAGLLEQGTAGVDLDQYAQGLNLTPEGMAVPLRKTRTVVLNTRPPVGLAPGQAEALTAAVLAALRSFHQEHPQSQGMPLNRLREAIAAGLAELAFHAFVRLLADRRHLILSNDLLSLPGHDSTATPEDEAMWLRVREALRAAGAQCPPLPDLARQLQVGEQALRDFLHRKSRGGELRRIAPNRFCLRETLARLADTAQSVAQEQADGWITAAAFRDAIGTGRGLAIRYLEFFDQIGVTLRSGDRRHMAENHAQRLQAADTSLPPASRMNPPTVRWDNDRVGAQPPEPTH